jgi:hypothetical protein
MKEGLLLLQNIATINIIHRCLQGRGRWKCCLGKEWDSDRMEFESLSSMHCRQPNPGPIAIIGHVRLKSHRLNPGIPQLAGQPIQLESRACEDSHVASLRSLTREKTILRILCAPTFSHSLGQTEKHSA